jgi:hypothetical protein
LLLNYIYESSSFDILPSLLSLPTTIQLFDSMNTFEKRKLLSFCAQSNLQAGVSSDRIFIDNYAWDFLLMLLSQETVDEQAIDKVAK